MDKDQMSKYELMALSGLIVVVVIIIIVVVLN